MPAVTLADVPRLPVTVGLIAASVVTLTMDLLGYDLARLHMSALTYVGEIWRPWTTLVTHADPLHLLFNSVLLWRLGGYLEARYGHAALLLMFALPGAMASMVEYVFHQPAIGLSGLVYALAGALWSIGRRDRDAREIVDERMIQALGFWAVLCVVLQMSGVWSVANGAHIAGAALGVLAGRWSIRDTTHRMLAGLTALTLGAALAWGGSLSMRPRVAVFDPTAADACYEGYRALVLEQPRIAERLLESAARYPDPPESCLHNRNLVEVWLRADEGLPAGAAGD